MSEKTFFDAKREEHLKNHAPLADRMRPVSLEQFIGQTHILGPGRLLRRAIQIDQLSSLIFYGPPGTGKTTLARIIAHATRSQFITLNAVLSGVADIRNAVKIANNILAAENRKTILFIDEVHRFNKSQQDALLPHVENGTVILIGATTENPYFEVIKALVSRSRIFQLISLTETDLENVLNQTLKDTDRGYGLKNITINTDAKTHLVKTANGDARSLLNALELAVETSEPDASGTITITLETAEESIQKKAVLYDKDGDAHYDTISAFIKSVRGSDPDASLYWMAKMIQAGEDPKYIFRRMLILASEDIGLADPNALSQVVHASQAFDYVGMPEGRFHLAQACLYLATAPKSNTTLSFFDALKSITDEKNGEVPNHLKDASRDKDGFGHGKGYQYPHAYTEHWTAQQYLPDTLKGKIFYNPGTLGYEKKVSDSVHRKREAVLASLEEYINPEESWQTRTFSNSSEFIEHIRDEIFSCADMKPDDFVLILNADNGLLVQEAARIGSTAGIWAETLEDKLYPWISKITNTVSNKSGAGKYIENGHTVLFDLIMMYVPSITDDFKNTITKIPSLLARNGRAVICIKSLSSTTKLYSLLPENILQPHIYTNIKKAENKFYEERHTENNIDIFTNQLPKNINIKHHVKNQYTYEMHFTHNNIQNWFDPARIDSYADIISDSCTKSEINAVKHAFETYLSGKNHTWISDYKIITLKKIK
jgi:putative ATPase